MSDAPPTYSPAPVVTGLVFTEGPRWHDGWLWFSDMHGHEVRRVQPSGPSELVAVVDQPSGIGFLPDGTPLVVSMRRRQLLALDGPSPTVHADLTGYRGDFCNDMLVDSEGRAYVGCRTHRRRGEPPAVDQLILVHPDGSSEMAVDDIVGPNGTVLTPDGATLIVAETQAHRVLAFDRRADGRLGAARVVADLGEKVFPDGLTIDEDGALWVATGFGGTCLRLDQHGHEVDRVQVSDRWIAACTLGGQDMRTLYLATAATTLAGLAELNRATGELHDAHLAWARGISTGAIEAVEVSVAGTGSP